MLFVVFGFFSLLPAWSSLLCLCMSRLKLVPNTPPSKSNDCSAKSIHLKVCPTIDWFVLRKTSNCALRNELIFVFSPLQKNSRRNVIALKPFKMKWNVVSPIYNCFKRRLSDIHSLHEHFFHSFISILWTAHHLSLSIYHQHQLFVCVCVCISFRYLSFLVSLSFLCSK